jgi:RNA polymerase sigma-70 factor (ECF subfamily)
MQALRPRSPAVSCSGVAEERTTAVVERYLSELAGMPGDAPAEPVIRALLSSSVNRLHMLCATLLHRSYPRLARPPLNLQAEETLSNVVERMMKAMRVARPATVRQFFAMANQHIRWELNDLARRFDHEARAVELRDSAVGVDPQSASASRPSPITLRMLEAIESLPEGEREAFCLVRIQGMTQLDAAAVLDVSVKTIQRRLTRSLLLLGEKLRDLHPDSHLAGDPGQPPPPTC